MWRVSTEHDDEAIVALSLALYREDPGPHPVPLEHTQRTLRMFREQPFRGRAVVLEESREVLGYALLASFWSNELGGEVCTVDELYVVEHARGRGFSTSLFDILLLGTLWQPVPVALELETTADNARARRLYERNGFVSKNLSMRRLATSSKTEHKHGIPKPFRPSDAPAESSRLSQRGTKN
jgi:diamine N-acetyltransferase